MLSEHRISILVLVGLPCAGKTTFSKWLLSLTQRDFTVAHVCYDDFLQFPSNGDDQSTEFDYKRQRLEIMENIKTLVQLLRAHKPETLCSYLNDKIKVSTEPTSANSLIICDDNNFYRSMRHKLFQLSQSNNLSYAQIYFTCDLQLSLTRNSQRTVGEKLTSHLIESMASRFERPQLHAWEAATLTLNAADTTFSYDVVMPFLLQTFEREVLSDKPEEKKHMSKESVVHQIDLLLRLRISELLKQEILSASAAKQAKAAALNAKRKSILKEITTEEKLNGRKYTEEELCNFAQLLH